MMGLNIEIDCVICCGPDEYVDKVALVLVDDRRRWTILQKIDPTSDQSIASDRLATGGE
jgi:hypothetical protein